MKPTRSLVITLILLIVVAALYRIIPARPLGFVPHIAMALFGGALIKDRKWAFALPIFSMFLSDLLYHALYLGGLNDIPGFYEGQLTNYILFAGLTLVGFAIKRITVPAVLAAALIAPTLYFLLSNFFVWMAGAGFARPKTFAGLMQCYTDALPFYRGNLVSTLFFSAVLFGGYYLLNAPKKVQPLRQ